MTWTGKTKAVRSVLREKGGAGTNASPARGTALPAAPRSCQAGPQGPSPLSRRGHSLCLLRAELLGGAALKARGPGRGGVHVKGGVEVNVVAEGWPAELQAQHLHGGRATGTDRGTSSPRRPGQRPGGLRRWFRSRGCSHPAQRPLQASLVATGNPLGSALQARPSHRLAMGGSKRKPRSP